MEIREMTALTLGCAIKSRQVGVREAVKACLDEIEKKDSTLHAFLETDEKKIYDRVKEVENGIKAGKYTGPLAGVPIAVKDNICTRNRKTTCASRILGNFIPSYDAEAVRRIESAGMIVMGKTNLPWEVPLRHLHTVLPETPGIPKKYRGAPQEVPVRQWRQMKCLQHWEVIREAPSGSLPPTAVWSA